MTVDAVRRTRRRAPAASVPEPTIAPPASIVIGEIDQTIFECPSCSRPLALGARRCPGCGTHLVRGVTLGKASGFVAIGLAVGLLAGAGGGFAIGLRNAAASGPAAVSGPPRTAPLTGSNGAGTGTAAPAPTATATIGPTATPPTDLGGVPPVTRSALVQIVATNGRLAVARVDLRVILDAPAFDASAVAQILRSLSADAVFGQGLADRVAGWSGSSAVATQLATFYGAIHEAAANGLVASVQNQAAYRSAANVMIRLLDETAAVDAAVRSVAVSAGLDLTTPSGAPTAP